MKIKYQCPTVNYNEICFLFFTPGTLHGILITVADGLEVLLRCWVSYSWITQDVIITQWGCYCDSYLFFNLGKTILHGVLLVVSSSICDNVTVPSCKRIENMLIHDLLFGSCSCISCVVTYVIYRETI